MFIINKNYFKKISLLILTGLFFLAIVFFFLSTEFDVWRRAVPVEADAYLNIKSSAFNAWPKEKQLVVLRWLEKNSQLSIADWQKLFGEQKRLALFHANGEVHAITLLKSKKIAETGLLITPTSPIPNKNPLWLNQYNKILRGAFNYYGEKSTTLWPELLASNNNGAIRIIGKYKNHRWLLNVSLREKNSLPKIKFFSALNFLPAEKDDILFIKNLPLNIQTEQNQSPSNLQILNKLSGNQIFRQKTNQENYLALTSNNNLDILKNELIKIFSRQKPDQTIKLLPDGTEALNLMAKQENWRFGDNGTEETLEHLENNSWQKQGLATLINNKQIRIIKEILPTSKNNRTMSSCWSSLKFTQRALFARLGEPFNGLKLKMDNPHNFHVCID